MSGASREGTPVINTVSGRQQGPDVGRGACAIQGDDHLSLGALRDLRGTHQAGTRMVFLFPEPPAGPAGGGASDGPWAAADTRGPRPAPGWARAPCQALMESEGNECKSPSPDFLPMKKTWETLRGENLERTMPALLLALPTPRAVRPLELRPRGNPSISPPRARGGEGTALADPLSPRERPGGWRALSGRDGRCLHSCSRRVPLGARS